LRNDKQSWLVGCVMLVVIALLVSSGSSPIPARPRNLSPHSVFYATGYNLSNNEDRGFWLDCSSTELTEVHRCSVARETGQVIMVSNFDVVTDRRYYASLLKSGLMKSDELYWVISPTTSAPVPIIPLADGNLLVPSNDRDELVSGWNRALNSTL
jgi:hypothetical protein